MLRLVLWPVLLTLVVNVLRLVLQVQGVVGTGSGGGGALVGITWLIFLFGGVLGWRIARTHPPRWRPAWLWTLLALIAILVTVILGFSGIDRVDQSEEGFQKLRQTVLIGCGVAILMALFCAAVWPRLAGAMLLYALPTRATVLVLTWLAKSNQWDTHYTKFGPSGIERESMSETLVSAGAAQFGFWVPFTVVGGCLAGAVAGALRKPQATDETGS